MFLWDWIDFAVKTDFGIVLDQFCKIEVGRRLYLPEEKREEELDSEIVCPKEQKGEKESE